MPVYIKITDIKGDVTPAGSGNGGVWKTTNFLTNNAARSGGPGGGPHVKVFSGSTGGSLLEVSQISLASGANAVEGRDASAKFKVEQLFNTARNQRTKIKVFICPSDPAASTSADNRGRLIVGTDQGIWSARKPTVANNLKQMPLPALNGGTVELIVTDASGTVTDRYVLRNVTSSHHTGGVNAVLCDGSVRF